MSIEKDSATSESPAEMPKPAAATAAPQQTEPAAASPQTEPAAASHQTEPPAGAAPCAELMIVDPLTAKAHDTTRFGILPLAASIALAAVLGGLAGAAAMGHLSRDAAGSAPDAMMAGTAQALRESVAEIGHDLAALKASIAVVQRNTGLQAGKLVERLERIEKGQAEPTSKLAKLAEAVDRLERRPAPAAAQSASDVTGSIGEPKQDAKPQYAEGWRLRDYYAGRAVVESQDGRFFEIGPGSKLPGLGRVDAIKREDGRVVVVTRNGLIAASIEARRMPYRY